MQHLEFQSLNFDHGTRVPYLEKQRRKRKTKEERRRKSYKERRRTKAKYRLDQRREERNKSGEEKREMNQSKAQRREERNKSGEEERNEPSQSLKELKSLRNSSSTYVEFQLALLKPLRYEFNEVSQTLKMLLN